MLSSVPPWGAVCYWSAETTVEVSLEMTAWQALRPIGYRHLLTGQARMECNRRKWEVNFEGSRR